MAALVPLSLLRASRHQVAPAVGAFYSCRRDSSNLATYKRGRGGRSSFSGTVATVLGSSGYFGKFVVNKLGKIGSQVICPYRGEPYYMKDLRLCGDLGQILFLPFELGDEESLSKVMKHSNVVINLVGRDWESRNFSYKDVHVDGARRIARIARESGVERLIHFSHLNATPSPKPIYMTEGSQFLASKYFGEEAVKEEFPDATIFRPADIYGFDDRFIRYYARVWRRAHGCLPLWKKGTQTIKMPVFHADVSEGVARAIEDPDTIGKTIDCVGPHSYYLSDLIDFFYSCMRYETFKRIHLTPFFRLKAKILSYSPSEPVLMLDKLEREHVSDELRGHMTLEDLGIKLTRIEDRAPWELKPFRQHRYYEETVGEFAAPIPPPVIA